MVTTLLFLIMDRDNLFKLGLTACAVGISFFILWGPKLGSRRTIQNGALIGLQNLGLTCFLNSLLQALASCPFFIEWLEKYEGNGRVTDSLISILKLLCYERSEGSYKEDGTHSPRELITALSEHGWSIAPQEQDAHELFLLLVTTLEEEEQKSSNFGKGSLVDALGGKPLDHGDLEITNAQTAQNGAILPSGHGEPSTPPRTLTSPFRGYLTSQLQCITCNYRSALRYDKFDTLSLHLPPSESRVTLYKLLDVYVRTEVLDDFACDSCRKSDPTATSKAIKTLKIGKLPKCLCLHISRSYMNAEGNVFKRDSHVDFPEFLHMSPYTHNATLKAVKIKPSGYSVKSENNFPKFPKSNGGGEVSDHSDPQLTKYKRLDTNPSEMDILAKVIKNGCIAESVDSPLINSPVKKINGFGQGKHLYRLKAVIEHKGSVDGGHFVTYRKGPLESATRHRSSQNYHSTRWFYTSDADIRKSTLHDAMLANAYMLFYEKCPTAYMDP